MPNSRSIARSDMPLRRAFWTAFHLSLCPSLPLQEGRLARDDGCGWCGGDFTIGAVRLIRLGFLT